MTWQSLQVFPALAALTVLSTLTSSSSGVEGGSAFPTKVYKGTHTAWILPGNAEDAPKLNMTKSQVAAWEGTHADVSFGGSTNYFPVNSTTGKFGYMYNQMLELTPWGLREYWMRNLTKEEKYEELFLHYVEDTPYNLSLSGYNGVSAEYGALTFIDGIPTIRGYTASSDHSGFTWYGTPPFSVFNGHAQGGGLFVYNFEKFSSLQLNFAQIPGDGAGGQNSKNNTWFSVKAQYISACDDFGTVQDTGMRFPRASAWSDLTILEDGTRNMTANGTLRFNVPRDWLKCSTYDGSGATYGGGQYFGNKFVRDGYGLWTVRVMLTVHNSSAPLPMVNDVIVPWFIRYSEPETPSRHYRTIPGWDAANDQDRDGWVNDTEFATRSAWNSTARFEYESRAIPLGRMWSTMSSYCRSNVWSNFTGEVHAAWLKLDWARLGESGAYNDALLKLVGPEEYLLVSPNNTEGNLTSNILVPPMAGKVREYMSHRIDTDEMMFAYRAGFANLLKIVKKVTGSDWIMGNISALNLLMDGWSALLFFWALDAVLREDMITPWKGMTGHGGIYQMWDVFVYAAYGKRNLVQVLLRGARAHRIGGTKENWMDDIYSGTLIYYLINVPESTAYEAWGNGFNYGSTNTYTNNWYEAGIPMNMAYQQPGVLDVDIGIPDLSWTPEDPVPYHVRLRTTAKTDYASWVMNSTSTWVQHEEIAGGVNMSIVPSMIYYAWRGPIWVRGTSTPDDAVLARRYTKGLILFRTDTFGYNKDSYLTKAPVEVPLNDTYRQVFVNGTRGPVVERVNVSMYGGALLELVIVTPTPVPTTPLPTTQVPLTTPLPVTDPPPTPVPETTGAPPTPTPAPTNPTTPIPATDGPPTTPVPATTADSPTPIPETGVPATSTPTVTTDGPLTPLPTTTDVPSTPAPETTTGTTSTSTPEPVIPTTESPPTPVPITGSPPSPIPSTLAPATPAPTSSPTSTGAGSFAGGFSSASEVTSTETPATTTTTTPTPFATSMAKSSNPSATPPSATTSETAGETGTPPSPTKVVITGFDAEFKVTPSSPKNATQFADVLAKKLSTELGRTVTPQDIKIRSFDGSTGKTEFSFLGEDSDALNAEVSKMSASALDLLVLTPKTQQAAPSSSTESGDDTELVIGIVCAIVGVIILVVAIVAFVATKKSKGAKYRTAHTMDRPGLNSLLEGDDASMEAMGTGLASPTAMAPGGNFDDI